MTAKELEHVDIPGKSTELVRGQLVVRDLPGTYHGAIAARLGFLVGARPDGSLSIIDSGGALNGEDVLPGFTCPLSDVLD